MLGEKAFRKFADQILSKSTADQTEVLFQAGDSALTRFANSYIHQNVYESDAGARVRVVVGKRTGVATTNDLSETALSKTLEAAMLAASFQPENPNLPPMPGPATVPLADAFTEATANASPELRARAAGVFCTLARENGLTAAGAFRTQVSEMVVANSLGQFAYHAMTTADVNTVIMSEDSSGYGEAAAVNVRDLDVESLAAAAVSKALRSRNPRPLPAGEYPVVLEHYATADMVTIMGYLAFSALAVQEGRSFMAGKFGQQVMSPMISIWDNGLDPTGIPMPFDFEGRPKQRVDLITNGVAVGVVHDSATALKEGVRSTGHSLPMPNSQGPFPVNVFMAPGAATMEEMIAGLDKGLLVTRFHYTVPVHPAKVTITGMTRDGTFWVEKGEIAYPVKNLRFTESYLDALNGVEAVGKQTHLLDTGWEIGGVRVPAMKLAKFRFTGATEF
jgi:predicted Zn-dependent protease